ncbi:MAG: anaerobic ribonucleoside-triphosphate reductase activating protein [Campylobacter sp.]|nr:anaerobic ribonucleoside-triphosphate reductase activating protein [Campylobacter sp.]
MTDFAGKLACVIWFVGCNMRCVYCYNCEIVTGDAKFDTSSVIKFLKNRVGKLEAVVFSGGECTINRDFLPLLRVSKELGFLNKIDTNGTNFSTIKTAVDDGLVDFVSLDFKSLEESFYLITNSKFYAKFEKTLDFLLENRVKFEVRTTVHSDFLDENDISKMANFLNQKGYKSDYFLQNFLYTGENFGCVGRPSLPFNPNKINSPISIKLRNF